MAGYLVRPIFFSQANDEHQMNQLIITHLGAASASSLLSPTGWWNGNPYCFVGFLFPNEHCKPFFGLGLGVCEDGYQSTWTYQCEEEHDDDHDHNWWDWDHFHLTDFEHPRRRRPRRRRRAPSPRHHLRRHFRLHSRHRRCTLHRHRCSHPRPRAEMTPPAIGRVVAARRTPPAAVDRTPIL